MARRALAFTVVLLSACSPKLELPPDAKVRCSSTADCPGGYSCRTAVATCVKLGSDEVSPELVPGSFQLTPTRVGSSTALVLVSFTVTEALVTEPPPAALLSWSGPGAVTRALTVKSLDQATHAYVLSYTPEPTDPEGDVSFSLTLTDPAGNQGHVDLPNVAIFDFTPPGLATDLQGAPIVAVALTPPATSPLRDVTAAGLGTLVRVSFGATEPLAGGDASPVVTLGTGSATKTLTERSGNGLSFVYDTVMDASLPDGPAALAVVLEDLAGNQAHLSLGTVDISTTPPTSPAVDTAGAVVYHRLPWGADVTGSQQAYFLRGAAGAVAPDTLVVAYSEPTVISSDGHLVGREIGRIWADGGGAFGAATGDPAAFQLFMGDAPDLYVAAVDPAGNVSDADSSPSNGIQAVLVRDVEWTATLVGKIPGRVFPNPHTFEGRQVWTTTLAQNGGKPLATPTLVGETDGSLASVRGSPWWQPARAYTVLGVRTGTGMVYDPVRGCRVAFGGFGWDACDSGYYCSQWESCRGGKWTRATWSDPEGDGNPALYTSQPLVWAGGRGASVLSDGTSLWEWNGDSWRRFVMADPEGDGDPAPRTGHAIAYDEARQRLVLFGGLDASSNAPLGDTWETDFQSWRRVCTTAPCTSSTPAPRSGHTLTYDPVHGQLVLVGGTSASPNPTYDPATWLWDGSRWTAACSTGACAAASPAQRSRHAASFDARLGQLVLFGGTTASGGVAETWQWDGVAWTQQCTTSPCNATAPVARTGESFFFDPDRGRTILFGGNGGGTECPQSWCTPEWEWDGSAWTKVTAVPAGPPNVSGVTPVFDPVRGRTVLFGGNGSGGATNGTYLYDGQFWSAASPATIPPARQEYAATWVWTNTRILTRAGYVVISGGANGSVLDSTTYTWSGTDWAQAGAGPSARQGAAMATSTQGVPPGGAVLFGGKSGATSFCDTWTLSAGTFTGSATCLSGSPSARFGHAMVRATGFSGAPDLLFFGAAGTTTNNEVWSFDGSAWTRLSAGGTPSATQPAARANHGAIFDTQRNRVLVFGGGPVAIVTNYNCVDDYGGATCHDFWEWDGGAWTRVFPVDLYGDGGPSPNGLQGMAFDTARGVGVAVATGTSTTLDTWSWNGGGSARPGQVFTVDFDAAQVTRSFDVLDLAVQWTGGGSGTPAGVLTPGASLRLWDNDAWQTLITSSTASPSVPETLAWSLSGDATLGAMPVPQRKRYMVGDQRGLAFALVPEANGGTAPGFGEVVSDYVEVTVSYRLTAP